MKRQTWLLAVSTLLLGARYEGCVDLGVDTPNDAFCAMDCEFGFKTDLDGNVYCECREAEACIEIYAGAHMDPSTGECQLFPTVCDIPSDFVPCCQDGDRIYAPGDSFNIDCNACGCGEDGNITCTAMYCEDDDQAACEDSGGTWDTNSCGNYECGNAPLCDAVIPGCDCGPERSFINGACAWDTSCESTDECSSSNDCSAGSACVVSCPEVGACSNVCAVMVCSFDEDCREGAHCEGSSVCPPNALCVWEGEPGVCVAD